MIELIQYRIVPTTNGEIELKHKLTLLFDKYSNNVTLLNRDEIKEDIIKSLMELEDNGEITVINENYSSINTQYIFKHISNRMILMFITGVSVGTIYIELTNYDNFYIY